MDEKILKLLYDSKQTVDAIYHFCNQKKKEEYLADLLLRSAVERQCEIIGEALNKIRKANPDILNRITESEKIIAFRNILIHAYDVIDHNIVWDIIENKVPILKKEILELISEFHNQES